MSTRKHMLQLGELIRTQSDSHMTANPLYVVYEVERIYTDHNPTDHEWFNQASQSTATEEEKAALEAEYDEFSEHPKEDWLRLGYIERDKFVTACLTDEGAKHFIRINGHNLTRPHIYVHGLYRNEEMLAIRAWLMSQPQTGDAT